MQFLLAELQRLDHRLGSGQLLLELGDQLVLGDQGSIRFRREPLEDRVEGLMLVGWAPREEGGSAFVRILSGAVSPSGRLTQSWPRSFGAVGGPGAPTYQPFAGEPATPVDGNTLPTYAAGDGPPSSLFSFGRGLSFTVFKLSKLKVEPQVVPASGATTVTITVTNTGDADSATPVQLFSRDVVAVPVRPASIQLVMFSKVNF